MIITIVRAVLLPVLALAILLGYGYALQLMTDALPKAESPFFIYLRLLSQGFLAASAVALVFAYPLAFIYRHNGFVVALFLTLPVLWLRGPELMDTSRSPISLLVSAWEVGAFATLLVVATALTYKKISRSNPSSGSDGIRHAAPYGAPQRER